ncbi:MAG: TonB-dependent receptor [Rubrivivax sp.]|nr:TonB-dependent receptor [Rubrivivax sp.]
MALALLALSPSTARAQAAPVEQVVITASGVERRIADTPYAVGVISAEELRAAGPLVNLSEVLARVPGIVASNRYNFAQDLQINSRGFGARSSFGVRGLRLYSDGIPASGPDGQGQVSNFDLAGAERIEVLRGPFTALYGSSSGGVIALVSSAPLTRRIAFEADAGSAGLRQGRISLAGPIADGLTVRAQLSRLDVDGFRPQSSAQRTLGNVRLGWEQGGDRVVLVLNSLNQPALDPLGLTRAQFDADPDQTASIALPQDARGQPDRFNTRKNTWQDQAGLSWRHRFAGGGALAESQLAVFSGKRSVTQWQSIPVATQANTNPVLSERQPGGVIDFDRRYQGLDARLVWRWPLADQRSLQLVAGAAAEGTREERRGFENFSGAPAVRLLGVTGRRRRDESNRVDSRDVYAQIEADIAAQWAVTAGVRSGRVAFESADRFIAGSNGNDSGALRYRYTNPVAALQWRPDAAFNVYLSAGRGFETPTLNELAYRPDGGAGFNGDLKAQTSTQIELGAKLRESGRDSGGQQRGWAIDAAIFNARTEDEIGVASNRGGRSTFRNVGRTLRRGAELSASVPLPAALRAHISATWLDATYSDGFAVCAALPCLTPTVPVPAGNRIAGTLRVSAYAELAWAPNSTWELAAEVRGQGRLPVNDVNSDFAAGFGLVALRARWQLPLPVGRLDLLARVENVFDRRVAGSVIVGEGSGRFFEPAPGRGWLLSARYSAPF